MTQPVPAAAESEEKAEEKAAADPKDATEADVSQEAESSEKPVSAPAEGADEPATAADKGKGRSRKSSSAADSKAKKLNKKASKARILHLDAKPGDHYFVKLKGFPQWPVIVCDEDMLPQSLIKSRPVTAKRADGTYREDYSDGAKKAGDRTFPVMYLHTNEL
jgi:hypothetical protein